MANKGKTRKNEKKAVDGPPVTTIVFFGIVILLLAGAIAVYFSQGSDGEDDESDIIDRPKDQPIAPAYLRYEMMDVNGQTFRLEDYRGKVVVMDMFATWCGPCEYQIGELQRIYERYSASDVVILSIDIDERETISQVQEFKAEHDAPWRFGMTTPEISSRFPASSIPTLYYLDREGNVVDKAVGAESYDDLRSRIDAIL